MNKAQLVAIMAEKADIQVATAETALNSLVLAIRDALADGETISLTGFGSFNAVPVAARSGRNPKTGETIQISARNNVKFSPGKALKDTVNP